MTGKSKGARRGQARRRRLELGHLGDGKKQMEYQLVKEEDDDGNSGLQLC